MKHLLFIIAMILGVSCYAETKLEGNTFTKVQVSKQDTKTEYTWKDKKGNEYPIYLSSRGKAYIIRISKNTGKEYKQYLPEVTEQLKKK